MLVPQSRHPVGRLRPLWKNPFFRKFDLIINSKDLANSFAIIADAAFNKLIKTGVSGIQNFFKPNDSEENKARDEDQSRQDKPGFREL